MTRKNGPSAPKFELSLVYLVIAGPGGGVALRERVEGGCRSAVDGFNIGGGRGALTSDDCAGQPAKHRCVVGGHPGRDRRVDPGFLVDVLVGNGLSTHGRDGRGDVV